MDKRRVRYGLLLPSDKFIELLSLKRTKDGFILWIPESKKHFTIISEDVSISSHKTDEIENKREHIGRIMKDITVDEEKFFERARDTGTPW